MARPQSYAHSRADVYHMIENLGSFPLRDNIFKENTFGCLVTIIKTSARVFQVIGEPTEAASGFYLCDSYWDCNRRFQGFILFNLFVLSLIHDQQTAL